VKTTSDSPPGLLQVPDPADFPPAVPHPVPADSRTRLGAGLARWWNSTFAQNAYGRESGTAQPGRGGHRFFSHLIEPVPAAVRDEPRADAPAK
jgi:hypothetical protein